MKQIHTNQQKNKYRGIVITQYLEHLTIYLQYLTIPTVPHKARTPFENSVYSTKSK